VGRGVRRLAAALVLKIKTEIGREQERGRMESS
jgi:hypothetical protein